jgi:hypothetical protein
MPKCKITPGLLETEGAIAKLEADGHSCETIHNAMYDITDGAGTAQRRDIMKKLYKREVEPVKLYSRWI